MALTVDTGNRMDLGSTPHGLAVRTLLLLLEDSLVRELLAVHLRAAGCFPLAVGTLSEARHLAAQIVPDLILLDLQEDHHPALRWALELARRQPDRPVLTVLLIAADSKAAGLGGDIGGADLCITKPFEPHDLVRRLVELMRAERDRPAPADQAPPLKAQGIEFDPEQATLRLWRADRWHVLDLSANECRLLSCLLNDLDRVHSRDAIREAVWPGAAVDLRTVDQAVRRLRRALSRVGAQNLIKTVNGAGYRLAPDAL